MKIKSVKLKNDYRNESTSIPEGTIGKAMFDNGNTSLFAFVNPSNKDIISFYTSQILDNTTDLFKIEYEQERKYIDVRIEYNDSEFGMSAKAIQESISNIDVRNEYVTKVTELPETFTREDMIEFLRDSYSDVSYEKAFDLWLSERSKK